MASTRGEGAYILGLDLGVQSIGWALVDVNAEGRPIGLRRAGVRCFESGVGSETQIEMGKDESANAARRLARLQRRQAWRHARRRKKVFGILQAAGLLPAGTVSTPADRDALLKKLDRELLSELGLCADRIGAHLLPYRLRAAALDRALPAHALGRALYHLAQRRGFLSNRKSVTDDDKKGEVKAGIAELHNKMVDAGARTLGEYLATLDPEEERIRARWTDRKTMLLPEFQAIWAAQSAHHAFLTAELKENLFRAIFFQRPLKSQKSLVGWCDLEYEQRRAPIACLAAQRLRYWQKINDLEIVAPDGECRLLTPDEKQLLAAHFDEHGDIIFDRLRRLLKLKKAKVDEPGHSFNLERGGEKKLPGNRTNARLLVALGSAWGEMESAVQDRLVDDLLDYENRDALARRLCNVYQLTEEQAELVADLTPEPGYHSLSRTAIGKLLPRLCEGVSFATARKEVYGAASGAAAVRDFLPPVLESLRNLRNPIVCRGLTELRKVVNALVRQYGKPQCIRIELARDLKRSRRERERIVEQNRDNERMRERARKFLEENGVKNPRPGDILKYLLWQECNELCPYTGKTISKENSLTVPSSRSSISFRSAAHSMTPSRTRRSVPLLRIGTSKAIALPLRPTDVTQTSTERSFPAWRGSRGMLPAPKCSDSDRNRFPRTLPNDSSTTRVTSLAWRPSTSASSMAA